MSAPVRGVDVSSWQHPEGRAIDWEKAKGAGYHFALVKASQGTGYVNQWVAHDLDSARAAGLLVGAYHYFEANQPAEQQASHFLSCLVGQDLGLGVWLDWECYEPVQFAHSVEINSFLATVRATLFDRYEDPEVGDDAPMAPSRPSGTLVQIGPTSGD